MRILSTITPGKIDGGRALETSEKLSVYYHDFFDYPLTFSDLIKWDVSKTFASKNDQFSISYQNNFYFLKGREGLIYKRVLRERVSAKKMEIAKKASNILGFIPSIKMIAVTGSLAMGNAGDESDIDLFIITGKNLLWTTRIFAYLFICLFGIQRRSPMDKVQKDKLCLNMWLDESDLAWLSSRNIYTAHEIAQVIPLINKANTYEKFLSKNKWILKYWPNSVRISNQESGIRNKNSTSMLLEKICYWLQYKHMKSKITREVITPTRAIFHPKDLSKVVLSHLDS